ncbi:MAG: polymer-forming cytoskeletal protein [Burkholderiaceae bacterium]|nr:polymer-forming cytoskeletal protein [Burkholderiaceae bacterium]
MPSSRQIDTLIAQHCTLEGDLNSENSVKIDGVIHGTLRCQGSAIIGETGLVKGDVHSVDLLVIGKLEGNVFAENLHLHATANIIGEINARTLQVDTGAHYSGTVTMRDEAAGTVSAAILPAVSPKPVALPAAIAADPKKT